MFMWNWTDVYWDNREIHKLASRQDNYLYAHANHHKNPKDKHHYWIRIKTTGELQ